MIGMMIKVMLVAMIVCGIIEIIKYKLDSKSKLRRVLDYAIYGVVLIMYSVLAYWMTDTFLDWFIITLLAFSIAVMGLVIKFIGNCIQRLRWILPVIVVPLICCICYGAVCLMTSMSLSEMGIISCVLLVFLTRAIQSITKENKKYRTIMIIEVFIVDVIIIISSLFINTKPMNIVEKEVRSTLGETKQIEINREQVFGTKEGKITVPILIKDENSEIEETRHYTYYEGQVELESVE